ncbi:MAG TPA: hypothetical protein VLA36_16580 [Longimicrobiales bacterium]|nr:hypothetical protein [Longimicrobiales bacterium]
MFRLDRSRRAGPLLEWKVRIFVVAAVLGLAGMVVEESWMTGAAILVLLAGVLVSFKRDGMDEDGSPDSRGDGEA